MTCCRSSLRWMTPTSRSPRTRLSSAGTTVEQQRAPRRQRQAYELSVLWLQQEGRAGTPGPDHKAGKAADGKRITDVFSEHFFTTNFWHMWKTLFAFEPWHSAIELRRYFLRFMHMFPDMGTRGDAPPHPIQPVRLGRAPACEWLTDRGVRFVHDTRVTDIDIGDDDTEITVRGLTLAPNGKETRPSTSGRRTSSSRRSGP